MEDFAMISAKNDGAVMVMESPIDGSSSFDGMETDEHRAGGKSSSGDDPLNKERCGRDLMEKKLSRHDRIELGRMFQAAVNSHDWELSERLILLADSQTLNDTLCIALDSIWFLTSHEELNGITSLLRKIVKSGAQDFTRAALRTSFLASCVSACQSSTMSLSDTVAVMAQRLQERLQECNGDEMLKAEAGAKVQKFTEWALKCIGFHSRSHKARDKVSRSGTAALQLQLQLLAFKQFLDLAGDHLTGKDFTEAFDAACFPLTLFSSSFVPGWATGVSGAAIQGLLGLLIEGGADNVNQCFLEASRFGSTELVRILLQVAQRNSLDVDVDLALGFASHYGKIGTMECLVEEGNAAAFLGPLMRAAERGCLEVVRWFVGRGCRDMELCLALTAATSASQLRVVEFILPRVPPHVLAALSTEILKAAGERSGGSFDGVAFLLRSNFLGDPAATYAAADGVATADDGEVPPVLRAFLREHWSAGAFAEGRRRGRDHYVDVVCAVVRGRSELRLGDLPGPVLAAVAYLPLYRECSRAGGRLLSQRLRGELADAVGRLCGCVVDDGTHGHDLLRLLEHHLSPFVAHSHDNSASACCLAS
ncbi:ankyrin repeat protein SKIP35-like [Wolffia australiana]